MKGIIADIKGKYAVVLTQDGLFKRVRALPGMEVGAEIDLSRPSVSSKSSRTVMKITSIAAACLLALGIGAGAYSYVMPYSYVDLDINPSIELTVNIYDRIIRVEALNEDGDRLIQDKSLKHMKLDSGVVLLLNSAVEQGYLKTPVQDEEKDDPAGADVQANKNTCSDAGTSQTSGNGQQSQNDGGQSEGSAADGMAADPAGDKPAQSGEGSGKSGEKDIKSKNNKKDNIKIENAVLLTVSSNDRKKADSLKKNIAAAAAEELGREKVKSEVLVGQTSIKQRDAAKNLGVTPGKLALIEDVMQNMPHADLDEFRNTAVRDLLELARNNKQGPKEEKDHAAGKKEDKQDNSKSSGGKNSKAENNSISNSAGKGKNSDTAGKNNNKNINSNADGESGNTGRNTGSIGSDVKAAAPDKDTGKKTAGNDPKSKHEKDSAGADNALKNNNPGKNNDAENNTAKNNNMKNNNAGKDNNTGKNSNAGKNNDTGRNDNGSGGSSKNSKSHDAVRDVLEKQADELKEERARLREELYRQMQDDKKVSGMNDEKKDKERPGIREDKDKKSKDAGRESNTGKSGPAAKKGK